jgi:hypothetical protein
MRRVHAFLLIALVAALAACAQQASTPLVPQTELSPYGLAAQRLAHAPCTIAAGLVAPVHGPLTIATAFGQLMETPRGVRYAYPGIALTAGAGKPVLAALSGRARYASNVAGFGPAIVVTASTGQELLYASFAHPIHELMRTNIRVKAGEKIAVTGNLHLRFFYAAAGNVAKPGTQTNPCGASYGAGAQISVMPQLVSVEARFHALSVDGSPVPTGPYPQESPDVSTPANLAVTSVVAAHEVTGTVYEHSDTFAGYYIVLCGNAVFATGHARYAGPFPYPNPTAAATPPAAAPSLPRVVFFRDAGKYGVQLLAPLPAPYAHACPAPPPANTYVFGNYVFGEPGQTKFVYYWLTTPTPSPVPTDFVSFSSSETTIVTVSPASPSPVPVFSTRPAPWPPPSPREEITATGTGATTIVVTDSSCQCTDAPLQITVNATPTPAPVPTPIPNE